MLRSDRSRSQFCCFALVIFLFGPVSAADEFLNIDGETVSYEEFEQYAYNQARQTYYHGKPPEGPAMIEFRQQVAEEFIDRKLKARHARSTGLEADQAQVDVQLAKYEQQYGDTQRWQTQQGEMLTRLRAYFEEDSLVEQLDIRLRAAPEPADGEVESYYLANIDKFTEPEKVHIAVILLGVPPWADESAWTAARDEAKALAQRIRAGLPFAEAAKTHSVDPTAPNGGDMGYLHSGALNQAVQAVVNTLQPGEMSPEPVTVLEGIALVKLVDRKTPQVHEFVEVRERATALWLRDASERAYEAALKELRNGADIQLDEEYLLTLP
jgi:parvulin-like peptidyl-prolyl isomerase